MCTGVGAGAGHLVSILVGAALIFCGFNQVASQVIVSIIWMFFLVFVFVRGLDKNTRAATMLLLVAFFSLCYIPEPPAGGLAARYIVVFFGSATSSFLPSPTSYDVSGLVFRFLAMPSCFVSDDPVFFASPPCFYCCLDSKKNSSISAYLIASYPLLSVKSLSIAMF